MSEPEARLNEPCCLDDWVDHWERKARKGGTAAGVTAPLVDALEQAGLAGRTVLDVGCAIGDLAIETVARGASSATARSCTTWTRSTSAFAGPGSAG